MPDGLLDSPGILWPALVVGGVATVFFGRRLRASGTEADVPPPPRQVILALAFRPSRARQLVEGWGQVGTADVRRQIARDFGFIPAYVLAGTAATLLGGLAYGRAGSALAGMKEEIVGFWIIAGLLDLVENVLLLQILPPKEQYGWQPLASPLAVLKLVLIVLGTAYPLTSQTYWLLHLLNFA